MAGGAPLNPFSFPYYPYSTTAASDFALQHYVCYTTPVSLSPYVVTTAPPVYYNYYFDHFLHPSEVVLTSTTNNNNACQPCSYIGYHLGDEKKLVDGCSGRYCSSPAAVCYVPEESATHVKNDVKRKNKKTRSSGNSCCTTIWMKKGCSSSFPGRSPVVSGNSSGTNKDSMVSTARPPNLRCFRKKSCVDKTSPEEYEFRATEVVGNVLMNGDGGVGSLFGSRTTVMIKNVPNKYTKEMLLSVIDSHCADVNQMLRSKTSTFGLQDYNNGKHLQNPEVVLSEFDFFYLPMDFCSGSNLGYAFVNFTSPVGAWRLYNALHDKCWPTNFVPSSHKICQITFARIQGLRALRMNFQNSNFNCNSVHLLPVEFHPPRNGTNFLVKARYIGNFQLPA